MLYLDATLDRTTNLEDTLATVEWLTDAGKIGALGAFGFAPERLVEARILASAGYPRIEVIDAPYNLLRRQPFEGDLRLVAGAQNLAVTPSHALEHGFLSGRHRRKALTSQGVRGEQLRGHLNRRGTKILRALDQVAEELSVPGRRRLDRLAARAAHDRGADREHVRDRARRRADAGRRRAAVARAGRRAHPCRQLSRRRTRDIGWKRSPADAGDEASEL